MSGPFIATETRLAEALGVARKTLRDVRSEHMEQAVHFGYDEAQGGAVVYSQAGIEAALGHLGISSEKIALLIPHAPPGEPAPAAQPAETDSAANDDAPEADPEQPLDLARPPLVEITVERCFATNRRIITGTLGTDEVRVRVKNSEKLRRGMVLRCTHAEDDIYELAERLPRFVGKR